MNKAQKFALLYLVVVLVLVYGYAVGRFQVFPHEHIEPLVKNFQDFSAGDPLEKKTSVAEKLLNDLGFSFERVRYDYPAIAAAGASLREHKNLGKRDEPVLVYVRPDHAEGYRVIVGALNLADKLWGALLIDSEGEILHTWSLSTEHLPTNEMADQLKNLYGVHVFPDGSVIFVMHEAGGGIVKVDACSKPVWGLEGSFHHSITPDERGNIWAFIGSQVTYDQDMVLVSGDTGEILKEIDMTAVRDANPHLHIWDLQNPQFANRAGLKKQGNMTHGNDIDPLPSNLVHAFPGFEADDLAISYATTNLIFILDPDTLKVKWWRIGAVDFQHDPDWEPDGRIGIFSNNQRDKEFSTIVAIDPKTYEHTVELDGKDYSFKSDINGRHQLTPFGTRFVTSSRQGWAFEVDEEGETVFSFVNNVSVENKKALHLAEAWRFEEDYFESAFWENCP
jgi:Arylsulfotransferase (ASST)